MLALVVVLLLTAAEFGFALYAFRSLSAACLVSPAARARRRSEHLCPSCIPPPPPLAPHLPAPPCLVVPPQRHSESRAAGHSVLLHVQDRVVDTEPAGVHVDERLDVAGDPQPLPLHDYQPLLHMVRPTTERLVAYMTYNIHIRHTYRAYIQGIRTGHTYIVFLCCIWYAQHENALLRMWLTISLYCISYAQQQKALLHIHFFFCIRYAVPDSRA